MNQKIKSIVDKARTGRLITAVEIKELLSWPALSEESFYTQFAAREMNRDLNDGKAEIHGQVGVITGSCPCNCAFCSFAASNSIFKEQSVQPLAEIIAQCQALEKQGANAIYLMATANFAFTDFIQIAREVRRHLDKDSILVANIGDFGYQEAVALKEAGVAGIYHAVRLGEGQVTRIKVPQRLETIQAARRAGLKVGTCVEPVGPEHSLDEIVEKTVITREAGAVFSGAARRIPIPNTELSRYGIISEARMAQIVAVVNLATGYGIAGNCTHEPNVPGAMAGANLLWAEAGANPRDTVKHTENSRGFYVARCRDIYREAETPVLEGPSLLFAPRHKTGNLGKVGT